MKSLEELKALRDKMQGSVTLRNESEAGTRVVVGMATCGIASGARPVLKAFSDAVQEKNLENIMVVQSGCAGLCQYEPIVEVYEADQEKVTYVKMDAEKSAKVVSQHLKGGKVVAEYTIANTQV